MNQATRKPKDSVPPRALHVAFELSKKKWKLAFSDGSADPARVVDVRGGDLDQTAQAISKAKERLGLTCDAPVHSCYEAGRDGFWIHRALTKMGVENVVVDPASLDVNRRSRRAKTDRLDALKLLVALVRHVRGERVWRVVRVPSVEDEDARQLHRDLEVLKAERRAHRMRIQSLLFTLGIQITVGRRFSKRLASLRTWDGQELPPGLRRRVAWELQRLERVDAQIRDLEKARKELMESSRAPRVQKTKQMAQLCGVGVPSAWVFVTEFFGWREFKNRREVAGASGLTPTPHNSGTSTREQGISKAGNARVRKLTIEIAWSWLRYQPQSKLSRWYRERFGHGSSRMRKVGIVAMARRLLIALWRFVEFGVVPEGARLKTVG